MVSQNEGSHLIDVDNLERAVAFEQNVLQKSGDFLLSLGFILLNERLPEVTGELLGEGWREGVKVHVFVPLDVEALAIHEAHFQQLLHLYLQPLSDFLQYFPRQHLFALNEIRVLLWVLGAEELEKGFQHELHQLFVSFVLHVDWGDIALAAQ